MSVAEQGVTYLGAVHNGFKLLTNSKHPIEQPEDLAGLKIRTPGSHLQDFFTAHGASPQAMSWSECFTALQQGTIDGHDNGLSITSTSGVLEVALRHYLELQLRKRPAHVQHRHLEQPQRGHPAGSEGKGC
ncbi:MAG: TRAP transporter substrate-binding protein DctP [Oscillospiraceae bacterium]